MSDAGTVVRREGDHAWVRVEDEAQCSGCGHAWMCGVDRRSGLIEISDTLGVKTGDRVLFSFSERTVARASRILYGVPLFFFVAGALIAYLLSGHLGVSTDAAAAVGGFSLLAVSFGVVRFFLGRVICKGEPPVKLVAILDKESTQD